MADATPTTWEAWVTLGFIFLMLVLLVAEVAPPYMIMMATLICFIPLGIIEVNEALKGFSDGAVLTIAVLFIVAKGIEQSGGLEYVSKFLFSTKNAEDAKASKSSPSSKSIVWIILKFTIPVAVFSGFLANIPLVAMMIPPIVEFARKVNMPPSKFLMPLSFAALLGGTLTLIGASTNLMVLSMAAKKLPELKMNIFEISIVGLPTTVAGIIYIVALSGKLLPDRLTIQATNINAREYNVVLVVKPTSSICRKSIDRARLRRTPGLHLTKIEREGTLVENPGSDFVLLPKDRIHFSGVIDSLLTLTQLDGLMLSEEQGHEEIDLNKLGVNQCLVEAVVASKSSMVHKRVSELQFRSRYKAAVVAVHRHNVRLDSAIGDIELEAGDCLLMVADGTEFVSKHRNNSTFALVSKLPGFVPIQRSRSGIAALIVLAMVVVSAFEIPLITASLFSAAGLLTTKSLTPRDAMESLELPVLIMIAAAFGISEALVLSGAADLVAKVLMGLAGGTSFGLLTCTYIATTVFSLAITNNAAVTIMFPVALAAAQQKGLDFRPFAYILMMASSAGLMTPTGCATNIMVYSPGGYKFLDYITYGGPLQIVLLIVTVGVTVTLDFWWVWLLVLAAALVGLTPILARQTWNLPRDEQISACPPDVIPLSSSHDKSDLPVIQALVNTDMEVGMVGWDGNNTNGNSNNSNGIGNNTNGNINGSSINNSSSSSRGFIRRNSGDKKNQGLGM